jgi:COP9 signalosome complex subunit 4
MSFDEADYILREILFDYYVSQELFKDAAVILSGINLDSSTNTISDQNKTEIYVKCAEAFLEDDETVDAEVFLNKASSCIQTVTEVSLNLRYRATYARVLDANRKFVEAAMRYYDLSNTTYADVSVILLLSYQQHSCHTYSTVVDTHSIVLITVQF